VFLSGDLAMSLKEVSFRIFGSLIGLLLGFGFIWLFKSVLKCFLQEIS